MSARRFLVVANWKSTGTVDMVADISRALAATTWPAEEEAGALLRASTRRPARTQEVVVCPSYIHMQHLEEGLGSAARRVALGAQDVSAVEGAAHTGEVTAEMLYDFGATWTLVGHSERRRAPSGGESDEAVALKAHHATAVGLSVIACVGESAQERDAGHGIKVITRQLAALAEEVAHWDALAIAYEPVWAIGTGHIASLEHVQEMHEALRGWVRQHVSPTVADAIRILYGGSVSMDNCEAISALPDVDGLLVGGAATRLVYAGAPGIKSEFAILVCRAAAAHHAAAGGPSAMAACEAGVAPRGKGVQGASGAMPATPTAGAAREQ